MRQRASADLQARVVALAAAGNPPVAIERELAGEASRFDIYKILQQARADGLPIPRFATRDARFTHTARPSDCARIDIPRAILARLQPAARARGLTDTALVVHILEAVGRDGLVAAVLDDGTGEAAG